MPVFSRYELKQCRQMRSMKCHKSIIRFDFFRGKR